MTATASSRSLARPAEEREFITADGTQFINDGQQSIMCSGVGTSDVKCYETTIGASAADSIVNGFFGTYAALLSTNAGTKAFGLVFDVSKSGETIAGHEHEVARPGTRVVAGRGRHRSVQGVVDADTGVLLLGETTTDGKTSHIEATDTATRSRATSAPAKPTDISLPVMPTQP